ncbi:predicted protein [Histoplasma mississippiense (nom. inval.)]|uniref:predicted protein n=1 Tax=Ajellomyces capsulatus (strain NAm1 / WU24) TaxID=2059318 RepID=UPI000157CC37|nr:predicted protein [Histoplasma mississippiense (nom. inval.)]EDN10532.1 predicted protein [Histoplasma mississippiense (nom. inval.)]
MAIIARTENFSVKVEHTVEWSTVASLQGAPVKSSSFEIMPTRGDSYFVSAGTGKLLPASLSDLLSSWAGVAMVFEAGYIRDVMRYSRSYPLSNSHLHITGEKTSSPCTVTLSFSESHTHTITIPSEALNTWPGRILRWENKRQSSGGECTCDWKLPGFISVLAFIPAVESHTGKLVVRLDASTSQNRRILEYAVTLGTAASEVILVLRDRKLRKRTSTLAMRENAEPNKITDRSQDRDDDQTTAHVPQTEIGRKRRTEVRQRLRLYCCTNNQTRAVPATLSQAIEIDEDPETETDSVLEMLPYSKLKQEWREQQQKRQTWVNRAIKCCNCEVTGSAVNKCACEHEFCLVEMEPNSLGARQSTTCSTHQRRYRDRNFTGCLTCKARHVKCDEAAPACRNCIKRGLHCDGAQNEILFKFFDPSQASSGFVKRQHKAFRRETAKNHGVSSSHPLPYKDPTSPCLRSVDLQSGTHASTESLAMDNPTTGDGKPPFQSTPNDEARDLQSHSSSYNPYSIDEANCYSDYSDIRGDICRGDENAPLAFIVFISEPVLQERLEYLKAHTSELHKQRSVFRTFSELRVDGPLALPYALCLVKTLRQHAGQQLLMNRLNDTILFLSTRLRGLLSTHLLYTHRDRISRASLLLQRPVFYKRSDLPGNIWQESTVLDFSLDGLTVTLHLSNYRVLKVSDELWKGFNSLASGIADPAVMFGVG